MRKYSRIEMLRFAKFARDNEGLKPIELIKAYDRLYPELTSKQKLENLAAALGMKKTKSI